MTTIQTIKCNALPSKPRADVMYITPRGRYLGSRLQIEAEVDANGNRVVTGDAAGPVIAAAGVRPLVPDAYHGYWSMASNQIDLAKGPIDLTGNGLTMSLGAGSPAGTSAGQAYNNAGYYTSYAVSNSYCTSGRRPNMGTDLIMGSFVVTMSAPAARTWFAGSMAFGSTSDCGIIFSTHTDGLLRVHLSGGGVYTTNTEGVATPAGTVADGSDHKITYVLDWQARSLHVWVDGTQTISIQGILPNATAPLGQWGKPMYYGVNPGGMAGAASQFRHIVEHYEPGGTLTYNISTAVAAYNTTPQDISGLVDPNSRRLDFFVAGQSNQQGLGVTPAANTGLGAQIKDPTYPNGVANKRSSWPVLAGRLGQHQFKTNVRNHAVGSTSLVKSWVGHVQDYSVGMWLKLGAFAAQGGRIYKVTGAVGGHNNISQATISTLSNGATDGNFTWTDFGADPGFRGVAVQGSAYWDPNGLIAAMLASIGASTAPTKLVYLAWGETDANIVSSRAHYGAALVALTNACLGAGASGVMLGHTFGTPGAFYPIYDSTLVPGLNDAIASFAGNGKVFSGGQLYRAFGVLATNPTSGIGVQADGLHGNDAAMDAAGLVIANDALKWLLVPVSAN